MSRLYTTRFIRTDVAGAVVSYAVPPGKRAVVRCLTCVNGSAAAGTFYAVVAGTQVALLVLQGTSSEVLGELRVAAYAGETIEVYNVGEFLRSTVTGYLFDDPPPSREPAVEVIPGEPEWIL